MGGRNTEGWVEGTLKDGWKMVVVRNKRGGKKTKWKNEMN